MAAAPVRLALVWHMHQPSYRDPATGRFVLPWTRLHATKDYADMVGALAAHPGVHATFSLTPILLEQLDAVGGAHWRDVADPHLVAALVPADAVDEATRRFLLAEFFHVHRGRMLEPHDRYRDLAARAAVETRGGRPLTTDEIRDLQVWFHLAWVDPSYRTEEPVQSLWRKGSGFSEAEKESLLAWGVSVAARTAAVYRDAEARGQVELATVPYHHPILPLLCDTAAPREVSSSIPLPEPAARAPEDAAAQLRAARRAHEARFGRAPAGVWPSEGAVSQRALEAIAAEGFRWAASDEETLRRALAAADDPRASDPGAHLQAWSARTDAGPVAMVFRDRRLSDLIGFTYMHWEPARAADDFVARVLDTARAWRGDGPPIVPVILDGENCWESYHEDGGPFLNALYGALEGRDDIRAVTVSEALDAAPPRANLFHVPVASWIRADLGIWVGHAEKNRAWQWLGAARDAIRAAEARSADPARVAAARDSLYAAEASDWFWWYGDDHPTAHAAAFDALFRGHARGVFRALDVEAPSRLQSSLRNTAAPRGDTPWVHPRVDGRESSFFEWRDAILVDPAAATGAMHQTSGSLREVRFGIDEDSLYVRASIEGADRGGTLRVALLRADDGGAVAPVAAIPLGEARQGAPEWSAAVGGPGDDGAYARDEVVEVRLPFARFGAASGEIMAWRLVLSRDGRPDEIVPRDGAFRVVRPRADRRLTHWSAT